MQFEVIFMFTIQFLACFNVVYSIIEFVRWFRCDEKCNNKPSTNITDIMLFGVIAWVFALPMSELTTFSHNNLLAVVIIYAFDALVKVITAIISISLMIVRARIEYVHNRLKKMLPPDPTLEVPQHIKNYPALWNASIDTSQAIVVVAAAYRFFVALQMT